MHLSENAEWEQTPCERPSLWHNNNDMSVGGEEAVKGFSLFDTNVERPVQQTL